MRFCSFVSDVTADVFEPHILPCQCGRMQFHALGLSSSLGHQHSWWTHHVGEQKFGSQGPAEILKTCHGAPPEHVDLLSFIIYPMSLSADVFNMVSRFSLLSDLRSLYGRYSVMLQP